MPVAITISASGSGPSDFSKVYVVSNPDWQDILGNLTTRGQGRGGPAGGPVAIASSLAGPAWADGVVGQIVAEATNVRYQKAIANLPAVAQIAVTSS